MTAYGWPAALPSKPCYDARPEHPQRHARTTAACLTCVLVSRAVGRCARGTVIGHGDMGTRRRAPGGPPPGPGRRGGSDASVRRLVAMISTLIIQRYMTYDSTQGTRADVR
jgi:hypothetical protein